MKPSDLRGLIALQLIPNLGAQRIKYLLQTVETVSDVFNLSRADLFRIDGIGKSTAESILAFSDWAKVDDILEKTEKIGAQIVDQASAWYPKLLKQIFDPPLLLWVKGNPEVLDTQSIAIVGTRRPTHYGRDYCAKLTKQLLSAHVTIISGLAYGIDAVAHQTTVDDGGKTVAVLGSGVDRIYPSRHLNLASKIIENGGAVMSEFPPGTKPDAQNFPVRNRVISGMSLGTLVIESGEEGGSMITARLALDQNREVFAVPHSLQNSNGQGGNTLIQKGGAKLVKNAEDVLEELRPAFDEHDPLAIRASESKVGPKWYEMELGDTEIEICQALESNGEHHLDDLAEKVNMSTGDLLVMLLNLEMQDCIEQKAGKMFKLKG